MMKPVIQFDVRPVLETGACPFEAIMEALDNVPTSSAFQLLCPFEPVPLLHALQARGWVLSHREVNDDCFWLTFANVPASESINPLILANLTDCQESEMVKRLSVILRQVGPGKAMIAETAYDPSDWIASLDPVRFEVELNRTAASRWELCVVQL
jgi:hypothetical protein